MGGKRSRNKWKGGGGVVGGRLLMLLLLLLLVFQFLHGAVFEVRQLLLVMLQ